MFNNFFDAFHYLKSHEMFQGMFESCLDIEVVKVNPLTKCIEDDENLNTEVNVWLECGKYSKNIRWHDINLDCGADTFEKVAETTGAGTACGRCKEIILNIIENKR